MTSMNRPPNPPALLGLLAAIPPVALTLFSACSKSPTAPENPVSPPASRTIDEHPEWSRDGNLLAFVHYPQDSLERTLGSPQVWIYDPDSTRSRFVTVGFRPRWFPSGDSLVFTRSGQIYTIDLLTRTETLLTPYSTSSFFPDVSPNGSRIAFDTDYMDPRGAHAIWTMAPDGSALTDISEHGTGEWRMARWSPDGSRILHIRYLPDGSSDPELFLMSATGADSVRLTNDSNRDSYPCWSPDGTALAWTVRASSLGSRTPGIWTMNVDGSGARLIAEGGQSPSWSAHDLITFSGPDQAINGIRLWSIRPDGSGIERVDVLGTY